MNFSYFFRGPSTIGTDINFNKTEKKMRIIRPWLELTFLLYSLYNQNFQERNKIDIEELRLQYMISPCHYQNPIN